MTTATTLNGVLFAPTVNKSANKGCLKRTNDWLKESNGAYRTLQAVDRVCKAAAHVFKEMNYGTVEWVDRLSGVTGMGVAALILPRLPKVTEDAYNTVTSAREKYAVDSSLKEKGYTVARQIGTLAETAASWGWAATLVSTNGRYKQVGESFDLIKNVADLTTAAQDYYESNKLTVEGTDVEKVQRVQKNVKDTKKEALLRIVKAVLGVAAPVLGMLAIVLSPAVALVLKLASSTVAIYLDFFKDSMEFKPLKFFEEGAAMNARRAWV